MPQPVGNGFWAGKAGSLWSRIVYGPLGQKRGFDGDAPGALTLEQVITHRGRGSFDFGNANKLEFCGKSPS